MQLVVAIIIVTIIYSVQRKLYLRLWDKDLAVTISFHDSVVTTGEKSYLIEEIQNAKFLPMPVFHVKFYVSRYFSFENTENTSVTDAYHRNDVFSVLGHQKITRRLDFSTKRRGFFEIEDVNVIAKDFFMTKTFATNLKNNASIYVLPKKIEGQEFELICNQFLGEMEVRWNLLEDPFLFRGVREYMSGDSIGRINWKATAKASDLMVNQYGHSAEQKVKILLNLDTNAMVKSDYLQELGISMASTVASRLVKRNIPVSLETNGCDLKSHERISVLSGCTSEHLINFEKALARIGGHGTKDDFLDIIDDEIRENNIHISYFIISSYYREDLLLKLDYLVKNGISVFMISPFINLFANDFAKENKRPYLTGWEVDMDEV